IPPGAGYGLVFNAVSTDGAVTCSGASASFAVYARTTSLVSVTLECHEPSRTGSIAVIGMTNICPVIDGISASPAEVTVGGLITLSAQAHATDNGPSPLTYAWAGTSAGLSSSTSPHPSFTCTEVGTPMLTLTVDDGDTDSGCPATSTVTVTCTAPVAPDPCA